jgi:hypothetical protein
MRNRHRARLCRSCEAPMAGDAGTCWRCGVEWVPEETPRTTLRLVPATAPDQADSDVAAPLHGAATSR